MHTTRFDTKAGEVLVIHDGGWMGNAEVIYTDGDGQKHTVTLPCELLIAISKKVAIAHVVEEVTAVLEQL